MTDRSYWLIAAALFRCGKEFSFQAKGILINLLSRLGKNEAAWPSQDTIAKDIGASVRVVRDAIEELENAGFITRSRDSFGGPTIYELDLPVIFRWADFALPKRRNLPHIPAKSAAHTGSHTGEICRSPLHEGKNKKENGARAHMGTHARGVDSENDDHEFEVLFKKISDDLDLWKETRDKQRQRIHDDWDWDDDYTSNQTSPRVAEKHPTDPEWQQEVAKAEEDLVRWREVRAKREQGVPEPSQAYPDYRTLLVKPDDEKWKQELKQAEEDIALWKEARAKRMQGITDHNQDGQPNNQAHPDPNSLLKGNSGRCKERVLGYLAA